MILDLGVDENVKSSLDFMAAEALLNVGNITVKSFIHSAENYGLIEVNKPHVKLKIENPKYGKINKNTNFKFTLSAGKE